MKRVCWMLVVVLVPVAAACNSEAQRSATGTAAVAEATAMLDSLGDELFDRESADTLDWAAPNGCDVHPHAPSQGAIGHALFHQYRDVTVVGDVSGQEVVTALAAQWRTQGHDVERSGADVSPSVSTRINGLEYVLVLFPPDASLRAFIPCD